MLDAGVNPLRQNRKGQQALDVITDETENGPQLRALLRKAIDSWKERGLDKETEPEQERGDRLGPKQGLHFMARTPENLLKLAANNDTKGVKEFILKMMHVQSKLKAHNIPFLDDFVVHHALNSLRLTLAKSRWPIILTTSLGI